MTADGGRRMTEYCHPSTAFGSLLGAEEAVAGVAKPWEDIPAGAEFAVERGGEDGNVGVSVVQKCYTFGGGDEAHEAQPARAGTLELRDGIDRRAAGGEHGVEHEDI